MTTDNKQSLFQELREERRQDQISRERIAVLETQMAALMEQHKMMTKKLDLIIETLAEAKGGWRMMMLLGGGAGAIGAILAKWLTAMPWTIR